MTAAASNPDGRPQLVEQLVDAVVRVYASLGIDPRDIVTTSVAGKMLTGEVVGWQGAFVPRTRTWYDILFHFNRLGAEHLAKLQSKNAGRDTEALLSAVTAFLGAVQAVHRKLFETGGSGTTAASSTLFTPPLAAFQPGWIDEAGPASDSHIVQMPHIFQVCDFHPTTGVARVKSVGAVEPGDVLNEAVAARGQNLRIPLISRGVVLNPERLDKVKYQLDNNQTLWIVEPSILTRRLHQK